MRSIEELEREARAAGGLLHSSALRESGYTDRVMRAAVERGSVRRVARSWLVVPGSAAPLIRAAEVGGRITCVTAAQHRGWWVGQEAEKAGIHLAVPASWSRERPADAVLHWAATLSPVRRRALVDAPFNVLLHVARCQPRAAALAIWESAIRTRSVDPLELARVVWPSPTARTLAASASLLSDSGLETQFVTLMRSIGVTVRQQVWIDGHPIDGVIGARLLVQLDGFAHHQAADRRRDLRADARLVLRGYTVLRFDYVQVLFSPDEVIATVSTAMAQRLHL